MSASETSSTQQAVQQTILNFAGDIRPQLIYILLHGVFGGILITMLLALFAFSSAKSRKTSMFIWAAITLMIGVTQAISLIIVSFKGILEPFTPLAPSVVVYLEAITPIPLISVDVLLFCRLLVVFPLSVTRWRTILAVYTLPVLLKLGRVGLLIDYAIQFMSDFDHGQANLTGLDANPAPRRLYKAAWFLTTSDNAFAAAIFVWKLRGSITPKQDSGCLTDNTGNSVTVLMRTLCVVAATTSVFPAPFYVMQLVLLVTTSSLQFTYIWVSYTGNYICIISSLFATVCVSDVVRFLGASQDRVAIPVNTLRIRPHHTSLGSTSRGANIDSSPDLELSTTGAGYAKSLGLEGQTTV